MDYNLTRVCLTTIRYLNIFKTIELRVVNLNLLMMENSWEWNWVKWSNNPWISSVSFQQKNKELVTLWLLNPLTKRDLTQFRIFNDIILYIYFFFIQWNNGKLSNGYGINECRGHSVFFKDTSWGSWLRLRYFFW